MSLEPVFPEETLLLDGWRFALDPQDTGEQASWHSSAYRDDHWERIAVPHSWNATGQYTGYEGIAWYRIAFAAPIDAAHAHVRIRFDAVFYMARVWLNGNRLGNHEGGYTPFEFDISSALQPGVNQLAVRVDNGRATDRLPAHLFEGRSYGWHNYGGIVRDVKLLITTPVYIGSVRVTARPHITGYDEADKAAVTTEVRIRNAHTEDFRGTVTQNLVEEAGGHTVAAASRTVAVPALADASVALQAEFLNPSLWHFDHPSLYRCVTTLIDANGAEFHRAVCTFGVRQVECSGGQFWLNGEPVRLVGLSRHADVPGQGLAESASVMSADFDALKSLNMVIGRPVHYPQHEFIYDYCDRHGILLCPELPAWQLTAGQMADEHVRGLARQQLGEMISVGANHPCIWAWSVGNELESDTVAGRAFVKDMVSHVKSLDPTRPVSFASYHLLVGRPWADATEYADFVMMNEYFGTWHGPKDCLRPALDTIHLTWPDRPVMISEFGFAPHWQRVEGPRMVDPAHYYNMPEDCESDSPEADAQRRCLIREQMADFRSRPFVSAAMFWAYRGGMGVVDAEGNPRLSRETLREEFAPIAITGAQFRFPDPSDCIIAVSLKVRGPVEQDLPAYTLRNYKLAWEILSPAGQSTEQRGELSLPVLPPGAAHLTEIEMPRPVRGSQLRLSVLRPTGFCVIDRQFESP